MFQIGESLREARTRRGLSPADVHKAIRIRERYLTALEEERWHMLPGEAYTRGFLKTYADYLGLDGNLYLDEYSARIRPLAEEPFVALPPRRKRRSPSRAIGVLVALVAIAAVVAGLAAWLGGTSTPRRATPPPPAAAKKKVTSVATTPPKRHVAPKPAFALISATRGRCWLLVRDGGATGTVLYEGMLEQGRSMRFRLRPSLWVRMGAPSALDLRVAGRLVPGLPSSPENLELTRSGAQPA